MIYDGMLKNKSFESIGRIGGLAEKLKEVSKILAVVTAFTIPNTNEANAQQESILTLPSAVELQAATDDLLNAVDEIKRIEQETITARSEYRMYAENNYGAAGLEIWDEIMRMNDEIARLSIFSEGLSRRVRGIITEIKSFGEREGTDQETIDVMNQEIETMQINLESLREELEIKEREWENLAK